MPDDRQLRVLIADDREENRYVLRRVLSRAGFDCVDAACGSKALEIAQTLPDLIVLDVRLPDMSGYEVCQKIKGDPRTASIPVLQISASFVSARIERAHLKPVQTVTSLIPLTASSLWRPFAHCFGCGQPRRLRGNLRSNGRQPSTRYRRD